MSNTMYQMILLFVFMGGFLVPVSGIQTFTAGEVEAFNGTDVKLRCSFISNHPVSHLSVAWTFQPLDGGHEESVFYYNTKPYPPSEGRFRHHVVWSGDVMKNDASITLQQVSPTFNGIYSCRVLNPPDVHGRKGGVVLRVLNEPASLTPYDWFLDMVWK